MIQYWIFALVGIIAVAYIFWAGARLLWAPGSMEEMTQSFKIILYIVIGLAIIPFAYMLISLIVHIRI